MLAQKKNGSPMFNTKYYKIHLTLFPTNKINFILFYGTDSSNYLIILIATMNLSCSHSIMSKTFRTHVNKTLWRKTEIEAC